MYQGTECLEIVDDGVDPEWDTPWIPLECITAKLAAPVAIDSASLAQKLRASIAIANQKKGKVA